MLLGVPLCENKSKLTWSSVNFLSPEEFYLHSHMEKPLFRRVALHGVTWTLSGGASIWAQDWSSCYFYFCISLVPHPFLLMMFSNCLKKATTPNSPVRCSGKPTEQLVIITFLPLKYGPSPGGRRDKWSVCHGWLNCWSRVWYVTDCCIPVLPFFWLLTALVGFPNVVEPNLGWAFLRFPLAFQFR